MKRTIIAGIFIFALQQAIAQTSATQASPSNLNAPANSQPVPNATRSEKSAAPIKPNVVLPSTEIPPIYPGAETHAPETQPNLIHPASPPAPTQPAQTQPLVPVETTNTLNPTQPPRDQKSKNTTVTQP